MRGSALGSVWRWGWIPAAAFLAFSGVLAYRIHLLYVGVGLAQLGEGRPRTLRLVDAGDMVLRDLERRAAVRLSRALGLEPPPALPHLSLFLDRSALGKLGDDPPASGFEYVPGKLEHGARLYGEAPELLADGAAVITSQVEVRFRGDFHYHYAFDKKSYRIKTGRSDTIDGSRRFNLIKPKTAAPINNALGYRLAADLGLLAPRTGLRGLSLNGNYQGTYLLVEQPDASLLLARGLLPGDLYSGDQIFGRNTWSGVSNNLFLHPGLWEKMASDSRYPATHLGPLRRLVTLVQSEDSEDVHRELEQLVDLPSFARMSVLETVLNSLHFDSVHNWRLYFDPGRGRFFPLVWDPYGYHPNWLPGGAMDTWSGPDAPPLYLAASPLMRKLFRNANFIRRRHEAVAGFLEGSDEAFLSSIAELRALVQPAVFADPQLMDNELQLLDERAAIAAGEALEQYAETIVERLEATHGDLRSSGFALGDDGTIVLTVGTPIRSIKLTLRRPPDDAAIEVRLAGTRQRTTAVGQIATDGEEHRLIVDLRLVNTFALDFRRTRSNVDREDIMEPGPLTYLLRMGPPTVEGVAVDVGRGFEDLRPSTAAASRDSGEPQPVFRALPDEPAEPIVWSGDIDVKKTTRLSRDLVIEPGTRVRLAPNVSLILRGRVAARGTREAPITVAGYPGEPFPWGSLVIEGPAAAGSALSHVRVGGGAGRRDEIRSYPGMLSIHDVPAISLDHCVIGQSEAEDSIYVVYSSIEIEFCQFEDAPTDAIDLDMSQGKMTGVEITGSRGNAVDLTGSALRLLASSIGGSAGAGLAVGGRSVALVSGSRFERNEIGLLVTDDSFVATVDGQFLRNGTALAGRADNWRYGAGGKALSCDSEFSGNGVRVTAGRRSAVRVEGSGAMADEGTTGLCRDALQVVQAGPVEPQLQAMKERLGPAGR